jgi:hypothetical protein
MQGGWADPWGTRLGEAALLRLTPLELKLCPIRSMLQAVQFFLGEAALLSLNLDEAGRGASCDFSRDGFAVGHFLSAEQFAENHSPPSG